MASQKIMRALATNPLLHMRFAATGQVPRTFQPASPLIRLLDRISPRDRARIRGFVVDESLGYSGSRQFHTAEQALRWCRPDREMLETESFPAESWRMKHFRQEIFLEELLASASSFPPEIKDVYPLLCNPRLASNPTEAPIDEVVDEAIDAGSGESNSDG